MNNGDLRALAILLVVSQAYSIHASDKPNVVFILADDLGWSDTTLFGTTKLYETPNIERLAARGMTFTRAYCASPLCSPTRASILTGLSPARHGITAPVCHLPKVTLSPTETLAGPPDKKATTPNSVTRLKTEYYTLAEMFKDNGYATGHFGKWHLGPEPYSPLEHGFDVDVPHHSGPGPAGSYVAPWKFKDFDHDPDVPGQHIEDRMASEAVAYMEKHRDEAFFLNYWMFSVHAPFDAKQSLIDRYRDKVNPNDAQRSPTYAAMIHSMDQAVGTLLDAIDRLGLADDTIVIFASDNGGNMYNEVDGTTPTSNAPLRGGKATMYEGGVRGPAIIAYPPQIKPGTRSDAMIQSCDFYPTLLDLLQLSPRPEQSFDGISILPALQGKPLGRQSVFTYFPHSPPVPQWLPPAVSVHSEDWKLIRIFHGGNNEAHRYKLFRLSEDPGENDNLASAMPDRVKRMDQQIESFLVDTGAVRPLPNPKFTPSRYRPDLEGIGKRRADSRKSTVQRSPSSVAGWQPSRTCSLSVDGSSLIIQSNGGDPYLSYSLPKSVDSESLVLSFSMISNARGDGQVFWQEEGVTPRFSRERSVRFPASHDDKKRQYTVVLSPKRPVSAIRIDPATGKGRIELSDLRLLSSDNQELFRWSLRDDGRK